MSTRKQRRLERKRAKAEERNRFDYKKPSGSMGFKIGKSPSRYVSPEAAESLTTCLACVNVISSSVAGLPFGIYRNTDAGRLEQRSHSLARLSRQGPNGWQTFPDLVQWLIAQTLLYGNGIVEIVTDNSGRVTGLKPIPWTNVSVQLLESGRLAYDIHDITHIHGGSGRQRRLLQDEVLHLRDRTDDGLIGRSRLSRAGLAVSSAIGAQEFAASMWENQATPSGVITTKKPMSKKGMENLSIAARDMYTGTNNARRLLVLDNEMDFKAVSVSPEDAELLASRRFSTEDIARIFDVPPTIIGDMTNSSFTNAETAQRYFYMSTIRQWVAKLEAEISRSLFTSYERDRLDVEFDMSGLLRGDPTTRWNAHKIAVDANILTVNEIREIEGFNPIDDDDDSTEE